MPAPIHCTTLIASGTLTLDTTERGDTVHADVPGGSALYSAVAASVLVPTRIVGIVGDDFPFDALRDVWERDVDRGSIDVIEGRTFRWHARYATDGDTRVTLSRDPGVAAGRVPSVPAMDGGDVVLMLGSTDPRVQRHVLDGHAGARLVGLDSMAHWWSERADALRALMARVDIVFVDEGELVLATGGDDLRDGARQLHDLGPAVVVVKRAGRGAWMQRRGASPLETPAVVLPHVIDTTGAGDAFAGAFVAALAHAPEAGEGHALRWATAVASFAVEGVGTTALATATREGIRRRMAGVEIRESDRGGNRGQGSVHQR